MPLQSYGVLLGTKTKYYRDQPDNYGRFFHGHIDVQAAGQNYNTAIDVDSNRVNVSVEWRIMHLRVSEWDPIFSLPDGFHQLVSNDASGAVDYFRDPRLRNIYIVPEYIAGPRRWWQRILDAINVLVGKYDAIEQHATLRLLSRKVRIVDVTPPWKSGTGDQALLDLEGMLTDTARVVIFGEYYPASNGRPPGLHDIHQNQGDPPDSQWWNLNGIWQDGLTVAIHSDGSASAFMNKFSTQAQETDAQGHPV